MSTHYRPLEVYFDENVGGSVARDIHRYRRTTKWVSTAFPFDNKKPKEQKIELIKASPD